MKILQDQKHIGKIHLLTQALAFIMLTKGVGLLYIQALAEVPGWLLLGLWITFNYVVLVLLVNLSEHVFASPAFLLAAFKILAIAFLGGLISYLFNLIYYRYHFSYIGKVFLIEDFTDEFWSFMSYSSPLIVLGELIRRTSKLQQRIGMRIKKTVG